MNIFLDEDGKIRKKEKCKIKSHFLLFFFSVRRQQLSFHPPTIICFYGGKKTISSKLLKILCDICCNNFSTSPIAFENVCKSTFHVLHFVSRCVNLYPCVKESWSHLDICNSRVKLSSSHVTSVIFTCKNRILHVNITNLSSFFLFILTCWQIWRNYLCVLMFSTKSLNDWIVATLTVLPVCMISTQ